MLGNQSVGLQRLLPLRGHWNLTRFFVTPMHWDETLFPWLEVGKHLWNHGDPTKEVLKGPSDTTHTLAEQLHGLSGDKILKGIVGGLGQLSPLLKHCRLLLLPLVVPQR